LEHVLFSDGNTKKIGWKIQTNDFIVEQKREHPDIYLDKVTNQQSKYIALHVGLFWSIGTFIIKNQDIVKLVLDDKIMMEHLSGNKKSPDEFIEKRKFFIRQLIDQRKLKIQYELVAPDSTCLLKIESKFV
jgi:hypothetical protein